MDMKPQKPTVGHQRWYWEGRVRRSCMDSSESEKEDDEPFNSVIRSARWRALEKTRISVGQVQ